MTRRTRFVLATAAVALLFAVAFLHWASRPQRLTGVLLDRLGDALGLEITASGINEYGLRGDPRFVVRDLVARQPGAPVPILRASRIEIALPWSTVRARGGSLELIRLEFDEPQLDLPALQRWQATRPPAEPPRVPTLTNGLSVRDGRLVGAGWSVGSLGIDVPALHPDRAVHAAVEGRVEAGPVQLPFDLALSLSRPVADATVDARGTVEVRTSRWRVPMRLDASARLRLDARTPHIQTLRLASRARYVGGDADVPFVLGLAGTLWFADGAMLWPAGIALRGTDAIPTLDARGRIGWHDELAMTLEGALAHWPPAWPALPEPIGRPRSPVPFELGYHGAPDFSGPTSLQLRHDRTSVDARFRLPDVLAWLDAGPARTPLPPVGGRMQTPRLEIDGATLEGVRIELDDAGVAGPGAEPRDAR
jgi:hypothetical protein